ncbi:MAG: NUDIX domain-containing protein [Endomicrobiaceae bacterium]|nr:NUDIX domain-containing protein [Endomicrobiaceae bacterium]
MDNTQETSIGAVVYKIKDNIKYFLLVYSVRNNEWSFPKGHIEENETEIETAKREIFEETGIRDLTFIDGFKSSDSYMIKGTLPHTVGSIIKKNVIYYLCYTNSDFINPNDNEINKCKWVTYKDALECLIHKQQRNILDKAKKYLEGDAR